ncbi:hypothetical protein G7072_11250 [Nocardioides sp. HDW12B]|uniref:hypothetical protein n=1 Tax=Nocardioides sp. HDW12B TaxID=2714939 RepID=UPI00140910C2|nr:hypothetical protein [Nocardioides sp. HDW12B]QIK66841.1 hypothetical protein G7072_11250 [Nocardioides sp. HDW12B]
MSVYDSGVSAYRDTTKWLVAFVPIGSLIAAAVTLGPDLVESIQASNGVGNWLGDYWFAVICGVVFLLGIGAILYFGAAVLSVAPTDIGAIQEDAFAPTLAKAIGEGVAAPEFFTPEAFRSAMADLANAWDGKDPVSDDDPRLTRLRTPLENLRQWSIFNSVQARFSDFVLAFILGVAAISTAIILAPAQLNVGPAIEKPTVVLVELSDTGEADLEKATSCSGTDTVFTAIDGTWKHPTLAVDGTGCDFGATWRPGPGEAEIRPQPANP